VKDTPIQNLLTANFCRFKGAECQVNVGYGFLNSLSSIFVKTIAVNRSGTDYSYLAPAEPVNLQCGNAALRIFSSAILHISSFLLKRV